MKSQSTPTKSLVVNNRKATKDKRFMKLTQVLFVPRETKKKPRATKYNPPYSGYKSGFQACLNSSDLLAKLGLNHQLLEQAENAFFDNFNVHYPGLLRKTFNNKHREPFLVAAVWAWGLRYITHTGCEEVLTDIEQQLAQYAQSQFNVTTLDTLHAYRLCYMLSIEGSVSLLNLTELCRTSMECLFYTLVLSQPSSDDVHIELERQLLKISYSFHSQTGDQIGSSPTSDIQPFIIPEEDLFACYGQTIPLNTLSHHQVTIDHITLATARCLGQLSNIISKIHQLQLNSDIDTLKPQIRDLLSELNTIYQSHALSVSDIGMNANLHDNSINYIDYMLSLDFIFETVSLLLVPSLETYQGKPIPPATSFWLDFYLEVNFRIINLATRLDASPIHHSRIIPLSTALHNLILLETSLDHHSLPSTTLSSSNSPTGLQFPFSSTTATDIASPTPDPTLQHVRNYIHQGLHLLSQLSSQHGPVALRAQAALTLLISPPALF